MRSVHLAVLALFVAAGCKSVGSIANEATSTPLPTPTPIPILLERTCLVPPETSVELTGTMRVPANIYTREKVYVLGIGLPNDKPDRFIPIAVDVGRGINQVEQLPQFRYTASQVVVRTDTKTIIQADKPIKIFGIVRFGNFTYTTAPCVVKVTKIFKP